MRVLFFTGMTPSCHAFDLETSFDLVHVKHNVIFDTGTVEANKATANWVALKGSNLLLAALTGKNLHQRIICRFEHVSALHVSSPAYSAKFCVAKISER